MRARFTAENSLNGFAEHEILEMLLFYIYPRCDTNALAHGLIEKFGTIRQMFDAEDSALLGVDGIGSGCISAINLFKAIIEHATSEPLYSEDANSYDSVVRLITNTFENNHTERLVFFTVSADGRVTDMHTVKSDESKRIHIDICKIGGYAVMKGCPYLLIAHNHPGRSSMPSTDDRLFTRMMMNQLEELGLKLFDHCIYGIDGMTSMRELGLLSDLI